MRPWILDPSRREEVQAAGRMVAVGLRARVTFADPIRMSAEAAPGRAAFDEVPPRRTIPAASLGEAHPLRPLARLPGRPAARARDRLAADLGHLRGVPPSTASWPTSLGQDDDPIGAAVVGQLQAPHRPFGGRGSPAPASRHGRGLRERAGRGGSRPGTGRWQRPAASSLRVTSWSLPDGLEVEGSLARRANGADRQLEHRGLEQSAHEGAASDSDPVELTARTIGPTGP